MRRILALSLVWTLAVSTPASFALRPTGLEETKETKEQLVAALTGSTPAAPPTVSSTPPSLEPPTRSDAAGLEEAPEFLDRWKIPKPDAKGLVKLPPGGLAIPRSALASMKDALKVLLAEESEVFFGISEGISGDPFVSKVLPGPNTDRFSLQKNKPLIIGRSSNPNVYKPSTGGEDTHVSNRHIEATWDGDSLLLRDLGSMNGTRAPYDFLIRMQRIYRRSLELEWRKEEKPSVYPINYKFGRENTEVALSSQIERLLKGVKRVTPSEALVIKAFVNSSVTLPALSSEFKNEVTDRELFSFQNYLYLLLQDREADAAKAVALKVFEKRVLDQTGRVAAGNRQPWKEKFKSLLDKFMPAGGRISPQRIRPMGNTRYMPLYDGLGIPLDKIPPEGLSIRLVGIYIGMELRFKWVEEDLNLPPAQRRWWLVDSQGQELFSSQQGNTVSIGRNPTGSPSIRISTGEDVARVSNQHTVIRVETENSLYGPGVPTLTFYDGDGLQKHSSYGSFVEVPDDLFGTVTLPAAPSETRFSDDARTGRTPVLGSVGLEERSDIDTLRATLKDKNAAVRGEAVRTLGQMRRNPEVDALLREAAEKDPNPEVRQRAVAQLAGLEETEEDRLLRESLVAWLDSEGSPGALNEGDVEVFIDSLKGSTGIDTDKGTVGRLLASLGYDNFPEAAISGGFTAGSIWRRVSLPLGKPVPITEGTDTSAGLEETEVFDSVQAFLEVHGQALKEQNRQGDLEPLLGAGRVVVVPAAAFTESVIAYAPVDWVPSVEERLKSNFILVGAYRSDGKVVPPAVVIQEAGTQIPAPNPPVPIIRLASLAELKYLTPGSVYAVAVNKVLAGQVVGPVIGLLTFQDAQGRMIHAIFA